MNLALNVQIFDHFFRFEIREYKQEEEIRQMQLPIVWEPKGVDPPHVNFMKRAVTTSAEGKILI